MKRSSVRCRAGGAGRHADADRLEAGLGITRSKRAWPASTPPRNCRAQRNSTRRRATPAAARRTHRSRRPPSASCKPDQNAVVTRTRADTTWQNARFALSEAEAGMRLNNKRQIEQRAITRSPCWCCASVAPSPKSWPGRNAACAWWPTPDAHRSTCASIAWKRAFAQRLEGTPRVRPVPRLNDQLSGAPVRARTPLP